MTKYKQKTIKGMKPKMVNGAKYKPCGVCKRGTMREVCMVCAERIEALQSHMESLQQGKAVEKDLESEAVKQWTQGTLFGA